MHYNTNVQYWDSLQTLMSWALHSFSGDKHCIVFHQNQVYECWHLYSWSGLEKPASV